VKGQHHNGARSLLLLISGTMRLSSIIHVVDDDASYRAAMERRLRLAGYEVLTYASGEQLLDQPPDNRQQGCILLDVRISGLSGPDLQRRLGELGSTLPIIFLSAYADIKTTVRTIKDGAEDFLTKPVDSERLLSAIERAIAQHENARQANSTLDTQRDRVESLTPRERQVFERVVRGKQNKQIANDLGSTERTIKAHRRRVMEKMMVGSLAELVSVAERLGLLTLIDKSGTTTGR
jgi:FixJ family two-component response regulator